MERQFDRDYIDSELAKIGARVKNQVKIYLIGGCAMSFRNIKESTRDVDILFENEEDCKTFCDALFGAEYWCPFTIKDEHKKLRADRMYENKNGMHLDIFVENVLGKLHLSETMRRRAEKLGGYAKLTVLLVSKEDIFLFKSLASEHRQRDLADMQRLYYGLDWAAMRNEIKNQKLPNALMELMKRRLATFSREYKLDVPKLV